MAAILTQWEQTGQYDPTNPSQKVYERYVGIPGGYGSFYYNRVPLTSTLLGLNDTSTAMLPDWLTALLVGAAGIGAGYLGMKYLGPPIKKKLHLSGHRRRR